MNIKTSTALLHLFFLCFITASCSNEHYNDFYESASIGKTLTLEKTDELTLNNPPGEQHQIGRLRFEFVSNRDNSLFAFYDEINRQFVITDNRGTIQTVISGRGRGPGELVKAGGFTFDEQNRLVVFDQGQKRITVFGLDGEIIHNAEIENSNYSIGAMDLYVYEGKIYADVIDKAYLEDLKEAGGSGLIGIYDYKGRLIDIIGRYNPSVREATSYLIYPAIHVDVENKRLISAHSSLPAIILEGNIPGFQEIHGNVF